jgi:hypothetical protein
MIKDDDFDEDDRDLEGGNSRGNSLDRNRIDPSRFDAAPVPTDFNIQTDDEMTHGTTVQPQTTTKSFFKRGIVRCGMFSSKTNNNSDLWLLCYSHYARYFIGSNYYVSTLLHSIFHQL